MDIIALVVNTLLAIVAIVATIVSSNKSDSEIVSKLVNVIKILASNVVYWLVLIGYLFLFTSEALSNDTITRYTIAKMVFLGSATILWIVLRIFTKLLQALQAAFPKSG